MAEFKERERSYFSSCTTACFKLIREDGDQKGISKTSDLIELGSEMGFVKKSGSFYSMGDTKLGQGSENVEVFLKSNPEMMDQLEARIREKMEEDANPPSSAPPSTNNVAESVEA